LSARADTCAFAAIPIFGSSSLPRRMLIKAEERGLHCAPKPSAIVAALEDSKRRGLNPTAINIDPVFRSFGHVNINASRIRTSISPPSCC
jgi:hypothetical protein